MGGKEVEGRRRVGVGVGVRRMHNEERIRGHANRGRVAVRESKEGAQTMRCPTICTHDNPRQLCCPLAITHGRHVWRERRTLKKRDRSIPTELGVGARRQRAAKRATCRHGRAYHPDRPPPPTHTHHTHTRTHAACVRRQLGYKRTFGHETQTRWITSTPCLFRMWTRPLEHDAQNMRPHCLHHETQNVG